MSDKTAYIYVRVPPELHARVKEVAGERGVSITQFVNELLEQAVTEIQIPLKAVEYEVGKHGYVITVPAEYWFPEGFPEDGGAN